MNKSEKKGVKKISPSDISYSWVLPWLETVRTEQQRIFNELVSTQTVYCGSRVQEC